MTFLDSDNFIIKIEKFDKKDPNAICYSICVLTTGDVLGKNTHKLDFTRVPKRISKTDLNRLIDEFIDIYFFAMKDSYIQNKDNFSPYTNLSIKWQNKFKKIEFDDSPNVPPELISFKKLVEQILCIEQ